MDGQVAASSMDVDEETAQMHYMSLTRQPRSRLPFSSSEFTVGYVYHLEMMIHNSSNGHPEQPERISRIRKAISDAELLSKMKYLPIRSVRREEAILVHSEEHWDRVLAIQFMTPQDIVDSEAYYESLSVYVVNGTPAAARLSCGGVIEACLAVARGELKKTFAIVRPPGHHAEPDEHMGFCFFNNVAIATRVVQLLTPMKKILILDWDVHHGNGTQRAFYDDPSVLYISLHRYESGQFYPCGSFGSMVSCGEGPGLGYSVNIPWPVKGMTDADYIHAFQQVVMPIAMEFSPDLVIISAGFDAADGDELGECHVTPTGFAHMTHMLASLAGGRLVVALEGGYNMDASASSAVAVARVILGEAPPELPPQIATEVGTETVYQVALEQSKYWKSVNPKACEPREDVTENTFSIPEILKAHRQHYLYSKHSMLQVPLMTAEYEERFGTQVMCTNDLLENKTLVVFVHEFGNLRVELNKKTTCDVRLEYSHMIDTSKKLLDWIRDEKYALLDVNLFPRPFATPLKRTKATDSPEHYSQELLTYLWDNYIQLSNAQRIILVSHGSACLHLMSLLEKRAANVIKYVNAVVQVVGTSTVPVVSGNADSLRTWYEKRSLVIVYSKHPDFTPDSHFWRRYGDLLKIDEPKPIKLMLRALPVIQQFVKRTVESRKA